ncbi:hypothetical protein N0V84_009511, partial [Fusarium piperis]
PGYPQEMEAPLYQAPLPPLPARFLLEEDQQSGIPPPPPPPPPPASQPQCFDSGFFDLSSQPNAAVAALPNPSLVALPPQLFPPGQGLPAPQQNLAPQQNPSALPSQEVPTPPEDLFTLGSLALPSQGHTDPNLPTPPQDFLTLTLQSLAAPQQDLSALPVEDPTEPTTGLLSDEEWNEILEGQGLYFDEDLSWGVRWIILRILNDESPFAKVVTFILRLSRPQVQEFLEIYLREEYAWRVWEDYVVTIPHMPLLEHALEKRITVPALLHYHRPALLTDHITLEDEERGVLFLQDRGMHNLASLFRLFCAEPYKDFLTLRIEWEIFQDGIDKQIIHQSVELGWTKPEFLKVRPAASTTSVPVDDSPLKFKGRYAPLFGTVGQRLPLHRKEGDGYHFHGDYDLNEDYDSEETQDEEKTTSPDKADRADRADLKQSNDQPSTTSNTPTTSNGNVVLPTQEPLPPLPFLPQPLGFQPCQKQEWFINLAFCRRHARPYRYVPGCFTNSLLEEGRDWVPHREACWPRGAYVELGPRTLQAYADIVVECSRHRAGSTGVRGMPNANHRWAQTVTSEQSHHVEATAAHHENNSLQQDPHQGSVENLSVPAWYSRAYEAFAKSRMDVESTGDQLSENGSFVLEEETDSELFMTPTDSTPPEYRLAMLGGFPNTTTTPDLSELAPSAQLRHRLDTDFARYLTKKSTTGRRSSTARSRSRKKQSSEVFAEDWEGGYDMNLPEAEKDTAYCPKRGDRKKGSRKAASGGRQRRTADVKDIEKNSETLVTKGNGDDEGPKDGHSALEANKESNSEITEAQGATNTETTVQKESVNHTNTGPASSGRIKIVLKSSSHTPTSPAESTMKSNSPIFGVDRNSTVASTRERVEMAHYAWSAEEATFASISTHARFAQTADRIVKPPSMGKTVSIDMSAEMSELERLQTAFENIEGAQKGQGAQDAERAEFAGCADRALYAEQAEAACFAVEVRDKDGDCEMKDVE